MLKFVKNKGIEIWNSISTTIEIYLLKTKILKYGIAFQPQLRYSPLQNSKNLIKGSFFGKFFD